MEKLETLLLEISARVIAPAAPTTSVTVPLTGESVFDDYIRWSDNYSLGSLFDANGEEQELSLVDLNNANPPGRVRISITGTNNRFTPEFEASGRFTFTASDGESVTVMLANADMTEIYQWTPANSVEVTAFVLHVKGLADQTGTITLTGEGTATPPESVSFSGEAGDPTLDINARVIPPAAPLSVSFSAEAGDPTLTIDARAISADPPIAAAFGMEAGDATLSISARAIAPVITLLLSDFDDTGLEVDAAALLVASCTRNYRQQPLCRLRPGWHTDSPSRWGTGSKFYPDGYQQNPTTFSHRT